MNDKCTHGWTTPPECLACTLEELESLRHENSRLREALERIARLEQFNDNIDPVATSLAQEALEPPKKR